MKKIDWACGMYGGEEMYLQGRPEERENLEDLSVDGKIIFK